MTPKKLRKGDEIRIIAPSRSMKIINKDIIKIAKDRLESLGFKVTFSKNIMNYEELYDSASIDKRIEDLHEAFRDKNVKGILTAIGGYNVNQILNYIDYKLIKDNPKILCGFSDITALQNAIYSKTGLVTYSGVHFSSFGMKFGFEYSEVFFKKMLLQKKKVEIRASEYYASDSWYINQNDRNFIKNNDGMEIVNDGEAEGTIIGGNLCTLNLLQGTEFMPNIEEKILFLEDTGNLNSNFLLEFDRNLESLTQQKGFEKVRGIIFGRAEESCEMSIEKWKEMINRKDKLKNIPILINANFGHTTPIFIYPIGGKCKIDLKNKNANIIIYD